jgi:hypothetical protein
LEELGRLSSLCIAHRYTQNQYYYGDYYLYDNATPSHRHHQESKTEATTDRSASIVLGQRQDRSRPRSCSEAMFNFLRPGTFTLLVNVAGTTSVTLLGRQHEVKSGWRLGASDALVMSDTVLHKSSAIEYKLASSAVPPAPEFCLQVRLVSDCGVYPVPTSLSGPALSSLSL